MIIDITQAVFFAFAALFPIVNPVGSSIIFLSLVKDATKQELNLLVYKISIYTTVMLIIVLIIGTWILRMFGISIPIVLIAGGSLLTYVGWQLLNKPYGTSPDHLDTTHDKNAYSTNKDANAFYPLTMPVTAGPTCMAVTMTLGAHALEKQWEAAIMTMIEYSIGIVLIGLTVFFCYRYSYFIVGKLKMSGKKVIMCLAAFLNICIGLQISWQGVSRLIDTYIK